MRSPDTATSILDRKVVRAQANASRPRKALASPVGRTTGASGQDSYFLATETVS
jgi:hypothetical protein